MELFTKTFSCTTFYGGKTLVFGPILPFQLFVGPISTKSWAQLFVEPAVNKKLKVGGGERMARSSWKGWMGKWSISMQISLRLIHLSIFKYLVLSKLRIPKIWSRYADLINCASLRQHISRHIFSQSEPFDVVLFFIFSLLKVILIR